MSPPSAGRKSGRSGPERFNCLSLSLNFDVASLGLHTTACKSSRYVISTVIFPPVTDRAFGCRAVVDQDDRYSIAELNGEAIHVI